MQYSVTACKLNAVYVFGNFDLAILQACCVARSVGQAKASEWIADKQVNVGIFNPTGNGILTDGSN